MHTHVAQCVFLPVRSFEYEETLEAARSLGPEREESERNHSRRSTVKKPGLMSNI